MNPKTLLKHFQLLGYRWIDSSNKNRVKHPHYPMIVEIRGTRIFFDHVAVFLTAIDGLEELNRTMTEIYNELYDETWKPRPNATI